MEQILGWQSDFLELLLAAWQPQDDGKTPNNHLLDAHDHRQYTYITVVSISLSLSKKVNMCFPQIYLNIE